MQVQTVIDKLSYTEGKALKALFEDKPYEANCYLVVASKIADKIGVSRSVIVNALNKLECCGIVKAQSLGIKGTHIEILEPEFLAALKAARI